MISRPSQENFYSEYKLLIVSENYLKEKLCIITNDGKTQIHYSLTDEFWN